MNEDLKDILLAGRHSLVLANPKVTPDVRTFNGMGVSDLLRLLNEEPAALEGARLADKIVGKAAASLMVIGGVGQVYADVLSMVGFAMLSRAGIPVTYGKLVDHIINRAGTGMCPLEARCMPCESTDECLAQIKAFVSEMKAKHT